MTPFPWTIWLATLPPLRHPPPARKPPDDAANLTARWIRWEATPPPAREAE